MRVTYARVKTRRSQAKMADDLGIAQSTYHKYEGRSYMSRPLESKFCELCNITKNWLDAAAVTDEMRAEVAPHRRPRTTRRKKAKKANPTVRLGT